LIQVVMLFVGDWLIRPQNRRALAFVTAASWAIVGSGFVMVGIHEAYRLKSPAEYLAGSRTDRFNSASAIFLLLAGAFCYFLAGLRWRQLNAQRPTKEARA
jgi:hypothetical protein